MYWVIYELPLISDAMLSDPTIEVVVNIYEVILHKYASTIDQGVKRSFLLVVLLSLLSLYHDLFNRQLFFIINKTQIRINESIQKPVA